MGAGGISRQIFLLLGFLGVLCLAVSGFALATSKHLQEGLLMVSLVRWAAPMIGAAGAAYVVLNLMSAAVVTSHEIPMSIAAISLAEALLLVICGLLVGLVAVFCHYAVSVRIASLSQRV